MPTDSDDFVFDELPTPGERFAKDLSALDHPPFAVPRTIDDAIMNRARAHFAGHRSARMFLRIGALVTAAAAVIVVAVHLSMPAAHDAAPPVAVDMRNANRPVDIVDALKLAKRIRAGSENVSRDDINRDGAVDQRDVDSIAMAAVKLPEAGVQ